MPDTDAKLEAYGAVINGPAFERVDFEKLNASYQTKDKAYAKEILAFLHGAFAFSYGTTVATPETCGDFIVAPAVIRAKNTGEICIGLVSLDLLSSGEHCDTQFITEYGIVPQSHAKDALSRQRISRMIPYDYWYTIQMPNDIHVCFNNIPPEVKEMLDAKDAMFHPTPKWKRHKGKGR